MCLGVLGVAGSGVCHLLALSLGPWIMHFLTPYHLNALYPALLWGLGVMSGTKISQVPGLTSTFV